jgi:hypothetical protein
MRQWNHARLSVHDTRIGATASDTARDLRDVKRDLAMTTKAESSSLQIDRTPTRELWRH